MINVPAPTLASVWLAGAGFEMSDELLGWPPDVFALTNIILERSDAFRFVLSPPAGAAWPPLHQTGWGESVGEAARLWTRMIEEGQGSLPPLVAATWSVLRESRGTPLERLTSGEDWQACEALLTLHAIADEACAGLFVAMDRSDGQSCAYRARGRELLAITGSLARANPQLFRVLPKIRTPPTGRASFSRYACVQDGAIDSHWHKLPARHPGTDPQAEHVQMLLLPWPLRVRSSDFHVVPGSVQRLSNEPFGFFKFAPEERLDLDLVDRVLVAAMDEVESVDVVVMPESAIEETDIAPLEALLDVHGVIYFQAGVRGRAIRPEEFGSNWVHIGVNQRLEKGQLNSSRDPWLHIRQNKLHRWSLNRAQIYQYNLGGSLHPDILWWEAMQVPRRSIEFLQVGEEVTIVSLVCEDLAQDDVADVIRSVGPTIVVAVLLDGPQAPARWGARYASVLADDPGSAVLTLTSLGMAQRSQSARHDPSRVIALWKDAINGTREISLQPGAHGVVLTMSGGRTTRRSADGRLPVNTGTYYSDVAVNQITASPIGAKHASRVAAAPSPVLLEVEELTILTGWAEGVAEALAYAPERVPDLLVDARPGASWRADFGLAEPSSQFSQAVDSISRTLAIAGRRRNTPSLDAVLDFVTEDRSDEEDLDILVRRVLRSTLEQLRSRQKQADGH